jgi:hypothetical protein
MSIDPKINSRSRESRPSPEAADAGPLDDARELRCWAECFDQEFGLGLPTPVIFLENVRVAAPGHRAGCNGGGPLTEVEVNRADLDLPLAFRLAGLLRELLRLREDGEGRPYTGPYLSAAVREVARGYGLSFDRRGRLRQLRQGLFTGLLEHGGVDVGALWEGLAEAAMREEGRPKRWACGCSVVLSVARLFARCTRCRRPFVWAELGESGEPDEEANSTTVRRMQGIHP